MAEAIRNVNILYKTENYIIIEKPVGIDSEKGVPALLEENGISAKCFHRLDRDVGGVMLLTLTDTAPSKLNSATFEKEYLAVVGGILAEKSGEMRDLLFHDRGKNKTYVVKKKRNGVKEAVLNYSVIDEMTESGKSRSLVGVKLVTGRTHQIRVQFASRGFPIVGDKKYGGEKTGEKLMLYSHRLSFTDPFTAKPVSVMSHPLWYNEDGKIILPENL